MQGLILPNSIKSSKANRKDRDENKIGGGGNLAVLGVDGSSLLTASQRCDVVNC